MTGDTFSVITPSATLTFVISRGTKSPAAAFVAILVYTAFKESAVFQFFSTTSKEAAGTTSNLISKGNGTTVDPFL